MKYSLKSHGYSSQYKPNYKLDPLGYDYYYFTKHNSDFNRVDFDGEVFTCWVENMSKFKQLHLEGKILTTYNTEQSVYLVEHRINKKKKT